MYNSPVLHRRLFELLPFNKTRGFNRDFPGRRIKMKTMFLFFLNSIKTFTINIFFDCSLTERKGIFCMKNINNLIN